MVAPREIKSAIIDGESLVKAKCPICGIWGIITKEMLHGKVSMICPRCTYNETHDFSHLIHDMPLLQ